MEIITFKELTAKKSVEVEQQVKDDKYMITYLVLFYTSLAIVLMLLAEKNYI